MFCVFDVMTKLETTDELSFEFVLCRNYKYTCLFLSKYCKKEMIMVVCSTQSKTKCV